MICNATSIFLLEKTYGRAVVCMIASASKRMPTIGSVFIKSQYEFNSIR